MEKKTAGEGETVTGRSYWGRSGVEFEKSREEMDETLRLILTGELKERNMIHVTLYDMT